MSVSSDIIEGLVSMVEPARQAAYREALESLVELVKAEEWYTNMQPGEECALVWMH